LQCRLKPKSRAEPPPEASETEEDEVDDDDDSVGVTEQVLREDLI
jgi:hypothetical protein